MDFLFAQTGDAAVKVVDTTAKVAENAPSAVDRITKTAELSTSAVVQSFERAGAQVVDLLPKIAAGLGIVILGYIMAKLVGKGIVALSKKLGLEKASDRSGLTKSMQQAGIKRSVSQIVGMVVFWLVMLVFLVAAFDIVQVPGMTTALEEVVNYIPNLLSAIIVVVLGLLLASFVRGLVATGTERAGLTYGQQLAKACYWLLAMITFVTAFEQMKFEFALLQQVILIAFAAVAVALALSFGLGGREAMSGILSGYYVRQRLQAGDYVKVGDMEGTVREVGAVATIIESEKDGMMHRHTIPNSKMLNEAVR